MIETALTVGARSPLVITGDTPGGTGALCSLGTQDVVLNNIPYRHLPFVPNGINWVVQGGQDVVSYNFSGCIMAVFNDGGIVKVCHVSTGANQDCKAAWAIVKARSKNVFEFKPSDFIETGGGAFLGCYGLITADFKTYAITVTKNSALEVKISAIKMAHLLR